MPISIKNVSYIYSKKTDLSFEANHNINLEIQNGEFIAIVGKTGCGKSTLIQQINGLLIPTSGEIAVDDFLVSSKKKKIKNLKLLRKKVGLVFQFPENQLFEETVEKDVMFGPINFGVPEKEALDLAHKALLKVGLGENFFKRSPLELSGGERRRVAIAGMIAIEPDVLVLDEPTAGLDSKSTKRMMEFLVDYNKKGKTIILVTHDMDLVFKYIDKVVLMDDGEIKRIAKPKELFSTAEPLYSLELPMIYHAADILIYKGLSLDKTKITDVESLVKEIIRTKKSNG